ncbi:dual specificity protein phosphatase 22-A-like [Watersipora subatra]|uniref:dual specificity protein phosphatase 22-A-like n=1 Tax=Watersipora subatra TaxID=2589382 RepID=UPI00355ADDC3
MAEATTDRKVLNGLYIGDLSLSKNEDFLLRNSITHILSALDESHPHFRDISYLCLDLSDSPHQRIAPVFGECIEYIHRARANGGAVLVHCSTGVSRGPAIVAAYLLTRSSLSLDDILHALSAVRPCSNPNHGFQRQLEDWSQQHRKKYTERVKGWPDVKHDDEGRCSVLVSRIGVFLQLEYF